MKVKLALRDPVLLFYMAFVFALGQLVRIPTSEGDMLPLIGGSLLLDLLLIAIVLLSACQVLGRLPDGLPVPILIPGSVALAFVSGGAATFLNLEVRKLTALGPQEYFDTPSVMLYNTMLAALYNLQYISIRHARLASNSALSAAEAGRRAALSELRRLRTQIQPHFMLNVLNNIQIEIGTSPAQASAMLSMLGDHLRNALELEDTLFVSLDADIVPIRSFIALQQMRFGTRIALHVALQGKAAGRMVPAFLLLPLVENATKFGYRNAGGQIDIRIEAQNDGPRLRIAVSNPGSMSTRAEVPGTQTGLANLRARLALHYPDRHRFTLTEENDRVVALIQVEGGPC